MPWMAKKGEKKYKHSSDKIKTSYSDLIGKVSDYFNWEESVQWTLVTWIAHWGNSLPLE